MTEQCSFGLEEYRKSPKCVYSCYIIFTVTYQKTTIGQWTSLKSSLWPTFSSQCQDSSWPGLFPIQVFIWTRLGAGWPLCPLAHHAIHPAGNFTSRPFRRNRCWAETPCHIFSCNQPDQSTCWLMLNPGQSKEHWGSLLPLLLSSEDFTLCLNQ